METLLTFDSYQLREFRAHMGYLRPEWFVEIYLRNNGYDILDFKSHHIEMLNAMPPAQRGQRVNIQAPRGSAKSTCMAVWYPLWRAVYKEWDEQHGTTPEEFILIVARDETMAISRLQDIARVLEENQAIREDFGEMKTQTWSARRVETKNGVTFRPLGRGQSPRGALIGDKRPTLIIVEDLEDPERLLNPELREKDSTWFFTDLMFASDYGGKITNIALIDTIKHVECIPKQLEEMPEWETLHYKAIPYPEDIYHPTAEHLWKEWEGYYSNITLTNEERKAQADKFYEEHKAEMTAGVVELWGEMMDYHRVRQLTVMPGYQYTMRELQNIPTDPSMNLFQMDNAVTFAVTDDGILRSDKRIVEWQDIGGFTTFLDTAGSKDSLEGSFACAVVVAWQPLPGHIDEHQIESMAGVNGYVLLAWMGRAPLSEQMEQAILLHQRAEAMLAQSYPESNFVCEQRPDTDGSIRMSTDHAFRAAGQKLRFNKNIRYYAQHQNKELRIETLQPYIAHGWLAFNEVGLGAEFWKEFRQFPSAAQNDAPDAVQGACRARVMTTHTEREDEKRYDPTPSNNLPKVTL